MLQFYDSDKRFPAWGFGARPIDAPVSHCFNLNGSSNYCEVKISHSISFFAKFNNSFYVASLVDIGHCSLSTTTYCIELFASLSPRLKESKEL